MRLYIQCLDSTIGEKRRACEEYQTRQKARIANLGSRNSLALNALRGTPKLSVEAAATTFADSVVRQSRGTDRDHDDSDNPADACPCSPPSSRPRMNHHLFLP